MYTPPPSSHHFNFNLLWQWGLVIGLLAFAFYAALAIKREKSEYEEEAIWFSLGRVKFLIAKWWAVREQSENLLKFYRSDTHYEWNATFELVKSTLTCDDYSYEYLEREEIVMDEDSLKSDKSEYLIASPEVNACLEDYWRIEGTGTIAESERLYLDLVVFKLKTHPEVYHCESRSSVLNGCLEGPYFEEAIKNIGLKVG